MRPAEPSAGTRVQARASAQNGELTLYRADDPDADLPTLKQTIGGLLEAFPDMESSEDDLLAADDRVAVRRTMNGTHQGEFMGIGPTGKGVTFGGIWLARLSAGKLDEQWVYFDALGLLRQIGAVPALG